MGVSYYNRRQNHSVRTEQSTSQAVMCLIHPESSQANRSGASIMPASDLPGESQAVPSQGILGALYPMSAWKHLTFSSLKENICKI